MSALLLCGFGPKYGDCQGRAMEAIPLKNSTQIGHTRHRSPTNFMVHLKSLTSSESAEDVEGPAGEAADDRSGAAEVSDPI